MRKILRGMLLSCLIAVTVQGLAWAFTGPQGGNRGVPSEAIDACKGKSAGDAVDVTTPRGETIRATCREIDGQLAALPEGGPEGPGKNQPPKNEEETR